MWEGKSGVLRVGTPRGEPGDQPGKLLSSKYKGGIQNCKSSRILGSFFPGDGAMHHADFRELLSLIREIKIPVLQKTERQSIIRNPIVLDDNPAINQKKCEKRRNQNDPGKETTAIHQHQNIKIESRLLSVQSFYPLQLFLVFRSYLGSKQESHGAEIYPE